MHKTQAQVRRWHQAMGDHFPHPGTEPVDVTRNAKLRLDLLLEELMELGHALGYSLDLVETEDSGQFDICWTQYSKEVFPIEAIDALCDLQYVHSGTCDTWGIDLEPYFDEVNRSNWTKVGGPIREDGKRLKPDTYEPPQISLLGGGRSKVA